MLYKANAQTCTTSLVKLTIYIYMYLMLTTGVTTVVTHALINMPVDFTCSWPVIDMHYQRIKMYLVERNKLL